MIEIIVPSPGESITQVQIARWLVENGQEVEKDQEIVEIDSDKATFPVAAPEHGILTITIPQGETANVGSVIATLEPTRSQPKSAPKTPNTPLETNSPATHTATDVLPASVTPLAKKMIAEKRIDPREVASAFPGQRITRKEIESFVNTNAKQKERYSFSGERAEERVKLSMLRLKLAERLVAVKNGTAMLTTFNEVNLREILDIKAAYSDAFMKKYGVNLGLTSFFAKAVTLALADFPQVNARIEDEEMVFPRYVDLGIAVSAPKGLVVPVIRNAESLGLAEIEIQVKELALKARNNRMTIDDMTGGTFTITNGGVFGSLMSTPLLNPPQSGILGMHKIMDRPVAVDGRIEIHPMMYIALSYDHRVIDGRESVGFLVKIKELLENPARLLTSGEDPFKLLLNI